MARPQAADGGKVAMNTLNKTEGAEGRNLEKGLFWRKMVNAAKHGTRLRGWWATGSDVND
jgi:hypothetical protein